MPSIIDKIPSLWKDFIRALKYKIEDISHENLANSLRLEEEYRKKIRSNTNFNAQMCMPWKEESQTSPTNLFKNKKKSLTVQGQQVKNKKKKVHYNCGKPDHVKKIVFLLK